MRSKNLTSTIAVYLVVLLVLTAGLTDIILTFYTQNLLIQSELSHHRKMLSLLQNQLEQAETSDPERLRSILQTLQASKDGNVRHAVLHMAAEDRTPVVVPEPDELLRARMKDALLYAVRTGKELTRFHGTTFGVFQRQYKTATVVMPLLRSGRTYAAVATTVSLEPIYAQLRQSQLFVLLYVVVNTLILTALGIFWFSRITVQPLRRLVQMADQRRGEYEFFHLEGKASNDYQRLSNSLNQMLMRIRDDRQQLQHTIASLEKTNRKLNDAKDTLVRAEKMASVGRMAAGVAHEIGNPIGIVLGYLQMLHRSDLSDEQRKVFLERSETEVLRIRTILHQLLHFSQSRNVDKRWVSVHALLKELVQALTYQANTKEIRVESLLEAEEDRIYCDELQLRQVLLNLLINATDSIKAVHSSGEGRIHLHTKNVVESFVADGGTGAAQWLQIAVSDNGGGFSSEDIDSIFDPFYTTKDAGRGTGLGLWVSFSIVESLGGGIRASNRPEGGASMMVQLPLQENSEAPGPGPSPPGSDSDSGGTISHEG
jgi:signal transduction histidine kinase